MPPDPDRLALLRAIAVAPDDDTPRLVYADWLDEHGSSDADAARAAFLRLACRLKPKVRITKEEQVWLAANWPRLLPALVGRLRALGWKPENHHWRGRRLSLFMYDYRNRPDPIRVNFELEFWRGFARRVDYVEGYDRVVGAAVADEPLARHGYRKGTLPEAQARRTGVGYRLGVPLAVCFGRAIWDRLAGFAEVDDRPDNPVKWYEQPGDWSAVRKELYHRVHEAMADAMTAEARRRAGWPEDFPTAGLS